MDTVEHRQPLAPRVAGDCLVGFHHELFDQTRGFSRIGEACSKGVTLLVEVDADFRNFQLQGAPAPPLGRQQRCQFSHPAQHLGHDGILDPVITAPIIILLHLVVREAGAASNGAFIQGIIHDLPGFAELHFASQRKPKPPGP